MKKYILLSLVVLCGRYTYAQLQWSAVATPGSRISTVHFIDKNIGFFATGTVPGSGSVPITLNRTTDGGTTWTALTIPGLSGDGYGIQDIYFEDALKGYACGQGNGANFWRTTDAGLTWNAVNSEALSLPVVIRKTPAGIFVSDFYNKLFRSTDNGSTFIAILSTPGYYAGMDFVDDLHGVLNPHFRSGDGPWHTTSDGGITWKPTSIRIEAWSMYGEKGTPRFYASPEGYSNGYDYHTEIFQSTDFGKSWKVIHTFPFRMNGHIDGFDSVLYVQTCSILCPGCEYKGKVGLYQSSNRGKSWMWIGGPDALNDTRFFIVPTCEGSVIYAGGSDDKLYRAIDTAFRSAGGGSNASGFCRTDYKAIDPIAPNASTTIPIFAIVSSHAIGAIPKSMEYRIGFNPAVVDTLAFDPTKDVTPPPGWSVDSVLQTGGVIVVTLRNDQGNTIAEQQVLGSVRLTAKKDATQNCQIYLDKITLLDDCKVTVLNPVIEMSIVTTIRLTSSSVGLTTESDLLQIRPNPATSVVTIQSPWIATSATELRVLGIRGEQVASHKLEPDSEAVHTLDITALPAGVYTIVLTSPVGQVASKSFVIH